MPSFDVVSEFEMQEVTNAVDQSNREVGTRFDFKGSQAKYEREKNVITMSAPSDFQLRQMLDILQAKLAKRGVDLKCVQIDEPELSGKIVRQAVTLRHGLEGDLAKRIVKMIKSEKMKVQAAIQGEKVRVSGKKRDDLQTVISFLKESDFVLPLQFENYRD